MPLIFINMLLLLLLATNSQAAETITPLREKLYYEAEFAGLNFGKIGIEIEQTEDKASIICDIASAGIMDLFVKHSSHTTLSATGSNFTYPDKIYESNYQTRKKKRHVKLVYKNGKIIEEIIEPVESIDKRPAVPVADKNAAYDLMSFLLQIRKELANAQANNKKSFIINIFDGRRLTQTDFQIIGKKTIKIAGKKYVTIAVTSSRKQLTGFTKDEIADQDPDEPSMATYFSDDEKLIPMRMERPFLLQKIKADLIKKCGGQENCLLNFN